MDVPLRKSSLFYSDLQTIADYIAADNAPAAIHFLDAVEETIELLRRAPEIGAKFPTGDARFENLRRITIRSFRNYLLFYDLRTDKTLLLRVVHGARDLEQLL